jgi:hypothetical protein
MILTHLKFILLGIVGFFLLPFILIYMLGLVINEMFFDKKKDDLL